MKIACKNMQKYYFHLFFQMSMQQGNIYNGKVTFCFSGKVFLILTETTGWKIRRQTRVKSTRKFRKSTLQMAEKECFELFYLSKFSERSEEMFKSSKKLVEFIKLLILQLSPSETHSVFSQIICPVSSLQCIPHNRRFNVAR